MHKVSGLKARLKRHICTSWTSLLPQYTAAGGQTILFTLPVQPQVPENTALGFTDSSCQDDSILDAKCDMARDRPICFLARWRKVLPLRV